MIVALEVTLHPHIQHGTGFNHCVVVPQLILWIHAYAILHLQEPPIHLFVAGEGTLLTARAAN